MIIEEAANLVRVNIGEPISIVREGEGSYIALAYRENHVTKFPYSTHYVYPGGISQGVYELTYENAILSMKERAGI